jgi:hypothetical protein
MRADESRSVRVAVALVALLSALAARLVSHFALRDVAHVMDEVAYLFEAKVIATGHLTAPVALPRAAFNAWFIDDGVARFGIFPPGWPAVLAIGVRLAIVPWINPLLHFATVVLVGRAGSRLGGPRLELAASLLYALSPQAVLLAASLMSHSLVAFAASVITLALATLIVAGDSRRYLFACAGAALGVVVATRPLCAVVLGVPFGVALALRGRRFFPVVAGAAAPFLLALGAFNRALTGSALRFPQSAYFDEHLPPVDIPFFTYGKGCNALGFGHACDHTVRHAVHTVSSALTDAGDNLQAWGALVAGPIALVGVVLALAKRETRARALWLVTPPLLAVVLYGLYWQAGVCYGARFYHAALPALVVLVAVGVFSVRKRTAYLLVASAALFDAAGYVVSIRELSSWSFWGTDDRFAEVSRHWENGRAIVLVAFGPDDVKNPALHLMGASAAGGSWLLGTRALSALGQNAPVVDDGQIVFAKFHPALVGELADRFPDRSLWLYTAWADRSKDVLERWDPAKFAGHTYRRPVDNFDGFRVAPPYVSPRPLMQEPTDEGWPR